MYTLYYAPDAASLAPHMCLIHADAPYELAAVPKGPEGLESDWYAALNPHGRVPTMRVGNRTTGDYTLYEAAALCLQIADAHPASGLMPPLGSAKRGHAYQWLVYLTNTLQADTMVFNYARRYAETPEAVEEVHRTTGGRLATMLERIDAHFATESDDAPWLLGRTFCAADYYLLMLCGWLEDFGVPRPPSTHAALAAHLRRVQALPAAIGALKAEGIEPHF